MQIETVEVALLCKFYQRDLYFNGGGIYGDLVIDHVPFPNEFRASLALGRLVKLDLVTSLGVGEDNRRVYGITDEGREFVDRITADGDLVLQNVARLLESSPDQPIASEPPPVTGEIADAEPSWSPLAIDRGDQDFAAALAAVERLSNDVQGDNGYAATQPVERYEVHSRLVAAVDFLKNAPALTESAINTYLLWPIRRIAARFPISTAIGAAGKLAWDTFSTWAKKHGAELLDKIFS